MLLKATVQPLRLLQRSFVFSKQTEEMARDI
jgi:hypothetical protein